MRKIITILLSVIIIFTMMFPASAATAVPSEKDPFGTSGFGPDAPEISAIFRSITALRSYKLNGNVFEIYVTVNNTAMPLYISFPSIGGFRFYSRDKGFFEPNSLAEINYSETENGEIKMVGTDGTAVYFMPYGKAFLITVYDKSNKKLLEFNSNQLKFGYSGSSVTAIQLEMPLSSDEVIYGTGERFSALDQNGRRTIMWNVDCAYHGSSETAELWRGYKNVPIIHSTVGYTLFYNSFYNAEVDIGYTDSSVYSFKFGGPELDFYLWTGTPKENIKAYTDLTGKSILPPKWAFRYLAGNGKYYWNEQGESASVLMEQAMQKYAELGTPDIAAMYLEGTEQTEELMDICEKYGVRYLKWNSPDLLRATQESLLPDISSANIPIVKYQNGIDSGSFIDFTHPNSTLLMGAWIGPMIESGLYGGLIDFGELIQPNTVFYNNKTGLSMHNYFSSIYAQGYNNVFKKYLGNDHILFARAACVGAQSYTGLFSGDQAARFYGLRQQLIAGLSVSSSGFSIWGGDLAGYEGKPTNEVYCRGMQFSAFQPIMRSHGTRTRMPWDFGTEGEKTYKLSYWLRENMLNTIYSSAIDSSITGLPIMRAFALEFPKETQLAAIDDSYIFCDDFLVAPVFTEGATSREVIFPEGEWYSIWDNSSFTGGSHTVAAPLTQIPAFLRDGSTVPMTLSPTFELADTMLNKNTVETLVVTPAEKESEKLYYKDTETSVTYKNVPTNNGYTISATTENETTALLAYGTRALKVVADGKEIEKLDSVPKENESGFFVTDDGKTIISLGNSDWENVRIYTANAIENGSVKNWDFNSKDELNDFNIYMNDLRVTAGSPVIKPFEDCFTWKNDSSFQSHGLFYTESEPEKELYWSGISGSAIAISPKNENLRNFETEISFKISKGGGATGAVMIGFREKYAGMYKPENMDSWAFGNQVPSEKTYSCLVSLQNENSLWVHNAGVQTVKETIPNAQFISNGGYYKLKLKVVENKGYITITSPDKEVIYTTEFNIYNNLNNSGAVSYYVNGCCTIDSVSLIHIENDGTPVWLNDSLSGDTDHNLKIDVRDIVRLKKYLADKNSVSVHTSKSDCNSDSLINAEDLTVIRKILLNW